MYRDSVGVYTHFTVDIMWLAHKTKCIKYKNTLVATVTNVDKPISVCAQAGDGSSLQGGKEKGKGEEQRKKEGNLNFVTAQKCGKTAGEWLKFTEQAGDDSSKSIDSVGDKW